MQQVQKHLIKPNHRNYQEIDVTCFASKNLYNCGVYLCRQAFFKQEKVPPFQELYHLMKKSDDYQSLPSKVAQFVIKQVSKVFKSYFAALREYKKNPQKFLGKPKLPKYKHKEKGRNIVSYNYQAVSRTWLKKGFINPSRLNLKIPTNLTYINEVRIIPQGNGKYYVVEVVYEKEPDKTKLDGKFAAIDIGLNNLATVASNDPTFKPFIVCGKAIKSCNQQYNKRKAKLQSFLPENKYTSRKLEALTLKRNNKMDYYLHTASRFIVNKLLERGVNHLVIGKNEGWKQQVNLGKKNNQQFVSIPHARLISQLEYKCELAGIKVTITEESYTSKCSFLDMESIKKHNTYLGKRVKRGLFKSNQGIKYNADLNGALNILRKAIQRGLGGFPHERLNQEVAGNSIFDGKLVRRLVVSPVRFTPYKA